MENFAVTLIEMDKIETQLRDSVLKAPDYFAADLSELVALHTRYAEELMAICGRHGWPTISSVGWDSAHAAARISRNCFSQPQLLHACLPIVEQACRFGEIGGNWFSELYDTIMYFENKPQVFGTIIDWNEKLEAATWSIIDQDLVDQRREAFSLEPLEAALPASLKAFREKHQPPRDYKKYRSDFDEWRRQQGWALLKAESRGSSN